jgi:hypothetical protein
MTSARTRAEQRVDALVAERRALTRKTTMSKRDLDRVRKITEEELPKAWAAVRRARGQED